MVMVNLST